jgi:regulatory protein
LQVRRRLKRRKRLSQKNSAQSSLRARALRLLARREHSRLELERKLASHAESPEELVVLLDELVQRGWLSEQRVIEQVVHARRGRFGSERIWRELRKLGIAEELIAEALPEMKNGDLNAARAVWNRKFGKLPGDIAERARQVRFMRNRGFSPDIIRHVITGSTESDD